MVPQLREDVLKLAWRAWQDLNLRLSAPEADVLSTELQAPNFSKSLPEYSHFVLLMLFLYSIKHRACQVLRLLAHVNCFSSTLLSSIHSSIL